MARRGDGRKLGREDNVQPRTAATDVEIINETAANKYLYLSPRYVYFSQDGQNCLVFEGCHLNHLKMKLKVKKRHCWRKCMIVIES